MFIWDPRYFLFALPALILAFYAQWRVRSTYEKYSRKPNHRGFSGNEAARILLRSAGLGHVRVEEVPGKLDDHYDPRNDVLRLSQGVARSQSVAALGIADEVPATEQSACQPHHPYGKSKLKAEEEVKRLVKEQGLPASIIRFSMVYGPGDWRDILKLTRMAKKGLWPKIGSRPKLTPLIHVDDAIHGLLLAAEKGRVGEVYFITNEQSEPFDNLRKIIQQALGVKRITIFVPEWLALSLAGIVEKTFPLIGKVPPVARKNIESTLADRVFSIEKARNELGFTPVVEPEQGLRDTVHWYQQQGWI